MNMVLLDSGETRTSLRKSIFLSQTMYTPKKMDENRTDWIRTPGIDEGLVVDLGLLIADPMPPPMIMNQSIGVTIDETILDFSLRKTLYSRYHNA